MDVFKITKIQKRLEMIVFQNRDVSEAFLRFLTFPRFPRNRLPRAYMKLLKLENTRKHILKSKTKDSADFLKPNIKEPKISTTH